MESRSISGEIFFFLFSFLFKFFTICRFLPRLRYMVVSFYLMNFLNFYGNFYLSKFKFMVVLCVFIYFFVAGVLSFRSNEFKIYKSFKESIFHIWEICYYISIDQLQFQLEGSNKRKENKKKEQRNIFQKSPITKSIFFLNS